MVGDTGDGSVSVHVFPPVGGWDGAVPASPVGVALLLSLWRTHDAWVSGAGSFVDRWTGFLSNMSSWRMRLLSLWARSGRQRLGQRFALPLDVAGHAHALAAAGSLPDVESWRTVELVGSEVERWFSIWERKLVDRDSLLLAWSAAWPAGYALFAREFEALADRWSEHVGGADSFDAMVGGAAMAMWPQAVAAGVVGVDAGGLAAAFAGIAARLVRERERQVLLAEPGADHVHLYHPLGV